MVFEMVGIGLFIPIILAVLDPEFLSEFPEITSFLFQELKISLTTYFLFHYLLLFHFIS